MRGVHHLEAAIARHLLDRFFRCRGGLLPLLGLAIGVDNLLVPADGIVIPERDHLAKNLDCLGILALVAIDRAQPLQEHGAIVALALGVAVIRLLGLLQQIL